MRHKILMWKTPQTCEDKKTTTSKDYQSKSTIRNQVTQIYLVILP